MSAKRKRESECVESVKRRRKNNCRSSSTSTLEEKMLTDLANTAKEIEKMKKQRKNSLLISDFIPM